MRREIPGGIPGDGDAGCEGESVVAVSGAGVAAATGRGLFGARGRVSTGPPVGWMTIRSGSIRATYPPALALPRLLAEVFFVQGLSAYASGLSAPPPPPEGHNLG